MYLVDTNAISELARPRPDARVLRWFREQSSIAISAISIEELAFGVRRAPSARRPKLGAWLEQVLQTVETVHDVTRAIALLSGELRSVREQRGRPVAQADMLIAATASIHGLALATRNVRDFDDCGVSVVSPFD